MSPHPTLYPIPAPPPARLSTMPKPRGGAWLDDEMAALRALGVDVLVCLQEVSERDECGLTDEPAAAARAGLEFHAFPVPDFGVPDRAGIEPLLARLTAYLREGRHVAVHCRGGIGRSSVVAAALLVRLGTPAAQVWDVVGAARGCRVPETEAQRRWLDGDTAGPAVVTPAPAAEPATAAVSERFVVLTGGPGSGKSTLVDHLRRVGFATSPEAGRAVIRDQVAVDGRGLPWADTDLYAELMLGWELRSYREAADAPPGAVFFDRGVPDLVGYFDLLGRPVPQHVHAAAQRFRYHRRVLAAPPWPEIYVHDAERRQSWEEAVRTYECVTAAYRRYGYELVPLPLAPVAERARFVLDLLGPELQSLLI